MSRSQRISPVQWYELERLVFDEGWSVAAAADKTAMSYRSATERIRNIKNGHRDRMPKPRVRMVATPSSGSSEQHQAARREQNLPAPRSYEELSDEAKRAYDDFEYFRFRYFGHVSTPWQIEAAQLAVELLDSPHKEFVVVNCPPGAGKTTLFTHDIPAWLTVRNRSMRGIIGSRTFRQAEMHCARLKRTFERTTAVQAKDDERRRGLAVDAQAVLAYDFGYFKPEVAEIWKRDQFTVAQLGDTPTDEKESTWTAFGMDSGSLGWRVNYITWDDVVDKTTIRTVEAREKQQEWWDDEAETRLEPGGVLVLPGQRLASVDLYRYCLDKQIVPDDEDDDDAETVGGDADRKYRHVVYRAHYEDKCEGSHKPRQAQPYPDGCLLDPVRLPWRDLRSDMTKPKFRTVFQQEDVDPSSVLVPQLWIAGGRGSDGVDYPGCWDENRGLCELPRNLTGDIISVATADPSPTKFWSIQWWVYHRDSEFRYLMDLERRAMDAPDFLDWNNADQEFVGILESWQERSVALGVPILCWVVERNAAQRFLLQYEHTKRWQAKHNVDILPHDTHRNKTDPDFGVQTIAPHYRYGRVRLPGKQGNPGRIAALKLVDEVTKWPEGGTDDCVMAHWFFEWNLPEILPPSVVTPNLWRPSWVRAG